MFHRAFPGRTSRDQGTSISLPIHLFIYFPYTSPMNAECSSRPWHASFLTLLLLGLSGSRTRRHRSCKKVLLPAPPGTVTRISYPYAHHKNGGSVPQWQNSGHACTQHSLRSEFRVLSSGFVGGWLRRHERCLGRDSLKKRVFSAVEVGEVCVHHRVVGHQRVEVSPSATLFRTPSSLGQTMGMQIDGFLHPMISLSLVCDCTTGCVRTRAPSYATSTAECCFGTCRTER